MVRADPLFGLEMVSADRGSGGFPPVMIENQVAQDELHVDSSIGAHPVQTGDGLFVVHQRQRGQVAKKDIHSFSVAF